MKALDKARESASRAWCQDKTQYVEMDVDLAEEFAKIILKELSEQKEKIIKKIKEIPVDGIVAVHSYMPDMVLRKDVIKIVEEA